LRQLQPCKRVDIIGLLICDIIIN